MHSFFFFYKGANSVPHILPLTVCAERFVCTSNVSDKHDIQVFGIGQRIRTRIYSIKDKNFYKEFYLL